MNLRHLVICTAATLLPLTVYPAGATGLSSYLRQIPAPPRSTHEAYQACSVDDGKVLGGFWVEIESPPAVLKLFKTLEGEGVLAASQGAGGAPPIPGMGAPIDAASAAAMAAAMQNMTPQEQQALGQQMAAQMSAQMTPGAMSPADSKMAALLGQRQQGSMARMEQDLKAQQDWPLVLRRWGEEHKRISAEESLKLNAWTGKCPKGTLNPMHKLKRDYAEKHISLMTAQLNEGLAAYDRRRIMATDEAGFAAQLPPMAKQAQGPLSKQGYSTARTEAVRSLNTLLSISDEIYRRAAYWHMVQRALTRDDLCE